MSKVNFEHPKYEDLKPVWKQVEDCIAGDRLVKAGGETYLPKPNPTDTSLENAVRYEQYQKRAVFYNVVGRTLSGLVGQVFARPANVQYPDLLEPIVQDSDGSGVSLEQQAKCVLGHVIANGRSGLFVDYPAAELTATRQDQLEGKIRPTILHYEARSIINWRTRRIGAQSKLTLVVLSESHVVDDDYDFAPEVVPQYRVLRLDAEGYRVELWRQSKDTGEFVVAEEFTPTDSNNRPLTEIPFIFVGWENNDPEPDLPPLYDLSILNLAHYRNSADYEESSYICGQPTLYVSGLDQPWVDDVLGGEFRLGSRGAIPLPEGGNAGLLQAQPNSLPKEAMDTKEKQMVALGAKLVEQKQIQRTATEAAIENSSETSVLASAANNTSAAFQKALEWCLEFVGTSGEVIFELNTDFDIFRLNPQEQAALLSLWQNDVITWEEMRDNLRRASIAELPNDEAKEQIEASVLNDFDEPSTKSNDDE